MFPKNPNKGQKHTVRDKEFHWVGDNWVKAGDVTHILVHHHENDPDSTEEYEFGDRWMNLTSGETFELVSPGVWRRLSHKPSIQVSETEPTTQASGLPLVDGDLWFDPAAVSMGIYYDGQWYDGFASGSTGNMTPKNNGGGG